MWVPAAPLKMILAANKYSSVRAAKPAAKPPATPPRIFVPTASTRRIMMRDWWWREIKDGGFLHEYVRKEKAQMPTQLRRVARLMANFKQNNKSDFRLVASVPARLMHRLKAEDPDFFSDNQNLKNLRRDNPDVVVKL
jgi:hypothetical protein